MLKIKTKSGLIGKLIDTTRFSGNNISGVFLVELDNKHLCLIWHEEVVDCFESRAKPSTPNY